MIRLIEMVIIAILVCSCSNKSTGQAMLGDLSTGLTAWMCSRPGGAEHIRSFYLVSPDDAEVLQAVQDRIEVVRRKRKSSWDEAAIEFSHKQEVLQESDDQVVELKSQAEEIVHKAESGVLNVQEATLTTSELKRKYDLACEKRNAMLLEMSAIESDFSLLDEVPTKHRPMEIRELPCPVMATWDCIRRVARR